jgi:hypothetical protein
MITRIKSGHRKMVLLALASAVLLIPVVHIEAQTITPQLDDLILGFRASGGTGQSVNLEVDLGNISNFYGAGVGNTIPLPALTLQDLSDAYGASWYTRTNLYWGAIATTGRAIGTPDSHAPVGTLWATDPDGQPAWQRGSVFAQKTASESLEGVFVPGANGSLYGATATSNSSAAADITASLPGSWSAEDLKTVGTSFGYFNPTVDNVVSNGPVASELYELQPGSGAGTDIGELVLGPSGLSFIAVPEPSAGVLVAIGLGSIVFLRRRRP